MTRALEVPMPRRLGAWQLEAPLGSGAFGTTWRAVDADGRTAAVKLLAEPPGDELRALARVCHPSIVGVLGGGGEPVPHLVMELARGESLAALLGAGPLPTERALAVAAALADALAAVHHANLVHGDVKPANVVVEGDHPWLVDFGLAGSGAGGTPLYLAPEQLQGAPASPASDVYAAGLVLWEMLHGAAPGAGLPAAERLAARLRGPPAPERCAGWLEGLLEAMLAVDPGRRPAAGEVADTLAAHGAPSPEPRPEFLLARARTVHVPLAEIEAEADRWLSEGGVLAVAGPSGSGRTHLLERIATELRARGVPFVRFVPGAPWAAVDRGLSDPALPGRPRRLPGAPDLETRAREAAHALVARAPALSVLADDLEDLDPGSRRVLELLASNASVRVCVAGAAVPAWASRSVVLPRLGHEALDRLARDILGGASSLEALVARMAEVSAGLPGPAVRFLVHAARMGALVRRAHRWHVDEGRLDRVPAEALGVRVTRDAAALGALIAVAEEPLPLDVLEQLGGTSDCAELEAAGLVVLEHGAVRCRSRAAARTLVEHHADLPALHQRLLDWLRTRVDAPLDRLGWHAAGAQDAEAAAEHGPAALAWVAERDVQEAGRLADALWAVAPVPALEAPRLEALIACGRGSEAARFGEERLAVREPSATDLPLLLALARLHASHDEDDDKAMACVARARACVEGPLPLALVEVEALAHFRADRVEEALQAIPDTPPEDDDRWLRLRGIQAQCLHREGRLGEAIALLEAIPGDLGRDRAARSFLDGVRGLLYWHAGRLQDARTVLEAAARREAGLPTLERARMLNNAAMAAYRTGDRPGALALWEKGLVLFERLEAPVEQVRVQVNLCVAYREAARWERARLAGEWAVDRAARLHLYAYEAMAAGNLGDLGMACDDLAEAERWYGRAEELARAHALTGELVELGRRRAELAVRREEPDALERCLAAAQRARSEGATFEECRASALVAVCEARRGWSTAIADRLSSAARMLEAAGAEADLAEVRLWAAEACLAAKRVDEAREWMARVPAYARASGNTLLRLRADALSERATAAIVRLSPLGLLAGLAENIAREPELAGALELVAQTAVELADADEALVLLEDQGWQPIARAGSQRVTPSPAIIERAMQSSRSIIAADLDDPGALSSTTRMVTVRLRSVLCVPLLPREAVRGVLYLVSGSASDVRLQQLEPILRVLAIQAAAATLRHRSADGDVPDLVETVLQATLGELGADERELALIAEGVRRMANISRPNDGIHARTLQVGPLLDGLVAFQTPRAMARGVEVDLEIPEDLSIQGDGTQLSKALAHLLARALDRTAAGGTVRVRAEARGDRVRIGIADPSPEAPRVGGQPGDPVAEVVQRHRGRLWVEPEAGGRVVWIEI